MVEITKVTWEQNGVEAIVSGDKKWLNRNTIRSCKFTGYYITISSKS